MALECSIVFLFYINFNEDLTKNILAFTAVLYNHVNLKLLSGLQEKPSLYVQLNFVRWSSDEYFFITKWKFGPELNPNFN